MLNLNGCDDQNGQLPREATAFTHRPANSTGNPRNGEGGEEQQNSQTVSFLSAYILPHVHLGHHWMRENGRFCFRKQEVNHSFLDSHGKNTIATSLIAPGCDTLTAAVIDFDDHPKHGHPVVGWERVCETVKRVLHHLYKRGHYPIPFRSSGGRGVHLWERFQTPQDAEAVRHFMADALSTCGFEELTGAFRFKYADGAVLIAELFPKSGSVDPDRFGDGISLPLSRNSILLDRNLEPLAEERWNRAVFPYCSNVQPPAEHPDDRDINRSSIFSGSNLRDVENALRFYRNDDLDYDAWVRVAFSLKNEFGDDAWPLFEKWSSASSKNDPRSTEQTWKGIRLRPEGSRRRMLGSIFREAITRGYQPPARRRSEQMSAYMPDPRLPSIEIVDGALAEVIDKAEEALIQADTGLYQRGSMIVRVAEAKIAMDNGSEVVGTRLVAVKPYYIMEMMMKAATWTRRNAQTGIARVVDCPVKMAEVYMAREGSWRLPVLTGVVNAPTLRADGSVLDKPGYDPVTGLLFDPQGVAFLPFPPSPTMDHARAGLEVLKELIRTFPFLSNADRAVALSAILTAVIRRSIRTAPMHAFTAPTAGSGKSLLADIVATIATGRRAAVISQGKTEEEMEKRLGAALIAGDAIITIDNAETAIGGELLCQSLTQPTLKIRVLGKSLNVEVPADALIMATGNNLVLAGDMTRRSLLCSLDPGVERPELRVFENDPLEAIQADRPRYLSAALTILLAYHIAGRPQQLPPLGSFATWSRWVRDALLWLGEPDPCITMEKVRASDPKLEALANVVQQWAAVVGDRRVPVKEVIEVATKLDHHSGLNGRTEFKHSNFREALLVVAGDGAMVNSRRLGKWLASNRDRIVGGMKLVGDNGSGGVQHWQLVQCPPA